MQKVESYFSFNLYTHQKREKYWLHLRKMPTSASEISSKRHFYSRKNLYCSVNQNGIKLQQHMFEAKKWVLYEWDHRIFYSILAADDDDVQQPIMYHFVVLSLLILYSRTTRSLLLSPMHQSHPLYKCPQTKLDSFMLAVCLSFSVVYS